MYATQMNKFFTFIALAAVAVFFASASSCSQSADATANVEASAAAQDEDGQTAENVAPAAQEAQATVQTEADKAWEKVKKKAMKSGQVQIETPMGNILVQLYDETPIHKENFLKLAYTGYYDDLLFHRVMNQFMIQGGDPDSKDAAPGQQLGRGGPDYKLDAEIKTGLIHKKGALAAARQPDQVNPGKKSSGSQFYIVQGKAFPRDAFQARVEGGNAARAEGQQVKYTEEDLKAYETNGGYPYLDGEYTVFGEVLEGLDVVDKIALVTVDRANRPTEDVRMKMTVVGVK